jgi:hypothetical protein
VFGVKADHVARDANHIAGEAAGHAVAKEDEGDRHAYDSPLYELNRTLRVEMAYPNDVVK